MKKALLIVLVCCGVIGLSGCSNVSFDKNQSPEIREDIDVSNMSDVVFEKYSGVIKMSVDNLTDAIRDEGKSLKLANDIISGNIEEMCKSEDGKIKVFRFDIISGKDIIGDFSILSHKNGNINAIIRKTIIDDELSNEFKIK